MNSSFASKHKLWLCLAACAAALTFSHSASALTVGDSHELGYLWPGQPIGNQNNTTYVNHLVGMALGAIDVFNGQIFLRSNHAFGSLPTAAWALSGTSTNINLGAAGMYTYLFANYAGAGAEVWYVGNLTGVITIPGMYALSRLTQWSLFSPGGMGVPDGGVTAMLLGFAVCGLGILRRFAMNQTS